MIFHFCIPSWKGRSSRESTHPLLHFHPHNPNPVWLIHHLKYLNDRGYNSPPRTERKACFKAIQRRHPLFWNTLEEVRMSMVYLSKDRHLPWRHTFKSVYNEVSFTFISVKNFGSNLIYSLCFDWSINLPAWATRSECRVELTGGRKEKKKGERRNTNTKQKITEGFLYIYIYLERERGRDFP